MFHYGEDKVSYYNILKIRKKKKSIFKFFFLAVLCGFYFVILCNGTDMFRYVFIYLNTINQNYVS